jgi:hypothetical protein
MTPATFYIVNGPRGEYYAVRNHVTGKFWTERTELAARQQAQDEGLALVAGENITHARLVELMISQVPSGDAAETKPPGSDTPTRVVVRRVLRRLLRSR